MIISYYQLLWVIKDHELSYNYNLFSSIIINYHQLSYYHQLLSMIINDHQLLSIIINYHQLSSIIINDHQWSSIIINYHQWSSSIINDHQWSSVIINCYQSSMIMNYHTIIIYSHQLLSIIPMILSSFSQNCIQDQLHVLEPGVQRFQAGIADAIFGPNARNQVVQLGIEHIIQLACHDLGV